MYSKKCPDCKKEMFYSTKESLRKAIKRNTKCCGPHSRQHLVGKINHSKKTRIKISKANKGKEYNKFLLGKHQTKEWIEKRSNSLKGRIPGFKNKKHSNKTKYKQRLARLKDLDDKFPNGWNSPNYNKVACKLFEQINTEMGWNGQHAEHGGEVRILGYFLDYYEPKINLVIEFDEERHNIPSIKEKDKIRQKEIIELLECKFIRIPENDKDNWRNYIK